MSKYDADVPVTFDTDPNSDGAEAVKTYLYENFVKPAQGASSTADKLAAKRARFDQSGLARDFDAEFKPATAEIGDLSVDGEWTLVPGADPDRRILYLHGGAFTVGSAISHRSVTVNLAKRTGCAVFAPNYRLMPENARIDAITDARLAYKWILENGPNGPAPVEKLVVAGDSAGGNLTLMLSGWARDEKLRAAEAIVGLSPATDSTVESPSIKGNFETDIMLKPLVGPLIKIPRTLLLWLSWKSLGMSPSDTHVSPLRGDLSSLPPTLIQASSAEMLYDDGARYVAKAKAQGSPATLQSWSHMCHVWHAFDTLLPEAHQAFDEIAAFLETQGVCEAKSVKAA